MNSRVIFLLLLAQIILAACSVEPEIIVVEITRLVPAIEEVEVTRLVEIEKEVTRIVQSPVEELADSTEMPGNGPHDGTDLEFLQIEFWPDYDKPSVLVLMTGEITTGVALPVEIAVPIPGDAEINAVAQIGEGGMTSIDYKLESGTVLFQSSTPEFRVEYYAPYLSSASTRSYDFELLAPFSISRLAVQIQRPLNASELITEPSHSRILSASSDGLDYYLFDPRTLPPGSTYRLQFSYDMKSDGLTADELNSSSPDLPGSPLHDQQALYEPPKWSRQSYRNFAKQIHNDYT